MPEYDVRQVLHTVKQMTTSAALGLHANAYVTKPVDLDQFMSAMR